jgi:hypothetical protein
MTNEGPVFRKENLRQLQDHPPQGRRAGDMQKPQTQAAAGVSMLIAPFENSSQASETAGN